ncbi:fungal-specific transcription factor domain-containing protein [Podospora australis]|uniref:Fungal-specific transcription factor domain-containing protein n=1 Tax=Podospora australis TaxID=1536484 RepID=A0AAN6X629_9PEZI|nr:fungal-specific transcription factor domain-containing protein [Podospora australis]
MASVLTSQPSDIKHPVPASRSMQTMPPRQEPTPPDHIKQEREEELERGRTRSRSDDKDVDGLDLDDGDDGGDGAHSSNSEGPARKRRRSRKGLDKKFECPEKGCGKSYSRAEHLYRHQLNHNPKQVYKCGIGDCQRTFVRLDLCNRHKDRHTAKGSALNRKDSMMGQVSPITDNRSPYMAAGSASPEVNRPGSAYNKPRNIQTMQYQSPKDVGIGSPYTPIASTPPTGYPNGGHSGVDYMHHDHGYGHGHPHNHPHGQNHGHGHLPQRPPHHSPPGHGPQRPPLQTNVGNPYGVMSPVSQPTYHSHTPQSSTMPFVPPQNFAPFSLPPSEFPASSASGVAREEQGTYAPPASAEYSDQHPQGGGEMMLLDQMAMPQTMPVFGSDSILNKSPYVGMPEDFMAYLFNTQEGGGSPMTGVPVQAAYNYGEFNQFNVPYYNDANQMGYFPPTTGPQQIMSVTNLLDQNLPESVISDEKSAEIFEFIRERFHENGHTPIERQREGILEGDRNDDTHMLSRKMMQAYIGSYWLHFSDQVPILHKPTFSPEKMPNLLLIAMMAIGAACLDKAHGQKVTKAGAQLSNFLAWHLRWEMFQDPNCRPPAKLWVFQTLLLLELYEKMYSTRELHERAHIHHATTITLMRRGRALIGKSALDSPPNPRDDKTNGSRQSSTSGMAHTPGEWWNHWITNEATRRAAFAAFVIDSIHATMFGHSTVMVAHEMRLPLPCDDKLWKATSGAEVGRIESNLLSVGNKPISFLEGLKRTLSGQEVQTNSFGRTILMAGLLSVSWHMNQRDLQVNSLGGGVSQALGGRDKWRGTLTRAFDSWKGDFDKTLLKRTDSAADPYYHPSDHSETNVIFESRIVLHHLAHMAMHVDIVDCQIFARAKRLLGRAIGVQDLNSAQRRMKENWAPTAKARDAAYYALRFLNSVLHSDRVGTPSSSSYGHFDDIYSARDDVLLNRPWVLYFAALVVWCYGYALEGPCPEMPIPTTQQDKVRHMREYLFKYGNVASPEELKSMKGINHNTPMLMVLRDTFEVTRWELLHEGATLLSNCIHLNAGQNIS